MTRIAIVGCGRIGGILAARFCRRPDFELTVVNRNPRIAEAVARQGLIMRECGQRSVARPLIVTSIPDAAPPFRAIILATKWEGLLDVARAYLPRLAPDGFFITVQNGLIALDLARILGADRIVPGCLMWGGVMDAPGEYRLTAEGMTIVGSLSGNKDRAQAAASVISAVSPVSISGNIEGVLWSKLAITASLTSLGAIGGVGFGRLVLKSRMRRLILSIGREVRDVAVATGVRLEPLGDGFDVPWLLAHDGYPNAIRHMVIVILGWKHRRTTPGMLVSLQRKQRTEVEHINGRVVAIGSAAGIAVPLNRAITDLLLEMDGGRRMPGPEALAVLEYSARAPMPPQARGSHES